jgi:flagellar assembly protein FliH
MSSRVLSGDDAGKISPIRWKRTGSAGGGSMAPEDGSAEAGDVTELRDAMARLQADAAAQALQARQAGFAEGEAVARNQLEKPLAEAADRLSATVAELAGLRPQLRREAEEDLVRLAVAVARRVLRRELTADPEAILGIVKAALDRIDAREILRLRVHPQDLALIQQALEARETPHKVEVIADPSFERGGLVFETARGNLDASVDSQLLEIERGFTDLVRRSNR